MKKWPYFLMSLLVVIGLGVMFYPSISSWYNAKYEMQAVTSYNNAISEVTTQELQQQQEAAQKYNAALTGAGIEDPFLAGSGMMLPENYTSILDIDNGVMGYISIPVIDVKLPIYHGTSDSILQHGVGHMEMTAFPIGGEGNHSVLTGHTGMPNATLFTDLSNVEIGDKFYISILNETLAYEVDQILVVEPSDTTSLIPQADKDYITLVTCTPYGINSHRLLVRGVRVPYEPGEEVAIEAGAKASGISYDLAVACIMLAVVLLALLVLLVYKLRAKKQRKARESALLQNKTNYRDNKKGK